MTVPGIHHVTAIAGDPQENVDFYTDVLGLRLVKKSVNQDDKYTYHLFYGDGVGSAGTSITFFPWTDARPGRAGVGQVQTTSFLIPSAAVDYWLDRFEEHGVDHNSPETRFDETVVSFTDPHGMRLELVAREDVPDGHPWDASPVPAEHSIRGFHGVTLALADHEPTADLLEAMGYELVDDVDDHRYRYRSTADVGGVVDLLSMPNGARPVQGAGTVHHVAFRVEDVDEQREWREQLIERGLRVSEVIDRKWFSSIYTRTSGGVLFEFATEGPGYDVDEPVDELGQHLDLPDWLEDEREEIEARLPDVTFPTGDGE